MGDLEEERWDFTELAAELEAMSKISREEWEKQFSDLRAEMDRMGDPFSTGPEGK